MMDLLRSYADDDIDREDKPFSLPSLFPEKSSAPSVVDTALTLSCATYNRTLSRPIIPTQHSIAFNPIYHQLRTPIYGLAHPFSSSRLPRGLRIQNSFLFDEQNNTFQVFDYASDPSAPSANAPVGDLEALQNNLSLSVYNLPPSVHKQQLLEQNTSLVTEQSRYMWLGRLNKEDAAEEEEERVEVENPAIDAWLSKNKKSPWSGKREELQTELTEKQKKYANEHSVTLRMCGFYKEQPRRTMETEGGGISHLIPNRQRQPTPLVGWRGFFWDLDGKKPEERVIWKLWLSFGERFPIVFNTYYTVEDEYKVQAGAEEVDQDDVDEIGALVLQCARGLHVMRFPTKEKFQSLLFDLLKFIKTFPPPATIVFVSGNAEFAPFLRKVKEKGYHLLVISESECASSAFQDVGLTLHDLIPAIHGKGFFPSEERGLSLSKK